MFTSLSRMLAAAMLTDSVASEKTVFLISASILNAVREHVATHCPYADFLHPVGMLEAATEE